MPAFAKASFGEVGRTSITNNDWPIWAFVEVNMPFQETTVSIHESAQWKPKGVHGTSKKLWARALCRAQSIPAMIYRVGSTGQGFSNNDPEFSSVYGLADGQPACSLLLRHFGRTHRLEVVIKVQEDSGGQYLEVSVSLFDRWGRKLTRFFALVSTWAEVCAVNFPDGQFGT